jgi:hypothetical protein
MKRTYNVTKNTEYLLNGIGDILVKMQNDEIPLETAKELFNDVERINKITNLRIKAGNAYNTNSKTIKQDLVDRQNDLLDIFNKLKNNEMDLNTAKALSSIVGGINKIISLRIKSEYTYNTNSKTINQDLADRQKDLLDIFDKLKNNEINLKTAKALSKKAMEQIRNVEKQIKGK